MLQPKSCKTGSVDTLLLRTCTRACTAELPCAVCQLSTVLDATVYCILDVAMYGMDFFACMPHTAQEHIATPAPVRLTCMQHMMLLC